MITFEQKRREEVTKKNHHALSYVPFLYEEKIRYDKHKKSNDPSRRWSHYDFGSLESELEYKVRVLKIYRLDYLRNWINCLTRQHVMSYETFHPPPLAFWIAMKRELNTALSQLHKMKSTAQEYRSKVETEMVIPCTDNKESYTLTPTTQRLYDGLREWLHEIDVCISKLTHKLEAHLQGTKYHLKYQIVYSGLPQKVCLDMLSNVLGYL